MLRLLWSCLLGIVLIGLMPARSMATGLSGRILLVSSEDSVPYQEAGSSLARELERLGEHSLELQRVLLSDLSKGDSSQIRLRLALGTQACEVLVNTDARTPLICALLPRQAFEQLLRASGRRLSGQLSALYLDQPLGRQLDLLRLALPQARRVGVLLGEESRAQLPALDAAVRPRELTLVSALVGAGEPVFQALRRILDATDVLLALPDPRIYNPGSVQNILLATYRAKIPLLAFSPAYVRAGALLSISATPIQLGRQAALMAQAVLQGRSLPQPQYPQEFEVRVNEHVARSLGLELDAQGLTERLRRLERAP